MNLPPFVVARPEYQTDNRGYDWAVSNARRIENSWRERGYDDVRVEVIENKIADGYSIFELRSNLIAGLPPSLYYGWKK